MLEVSCLISAVSGKSEVTATAMVMNNLHYMRQLEFYFLCNEPFKMLGVC